MRDLLLSVCRPHDHPAHDWRTDHADDMAAAALAQQAGMQELATKPCHNPAWGPGGAQHWHHLRCAGGRANG
jgi:hypothetical protein